MEISAKNGTNIKDAFNTLINDRIEYMRAGSFITKESIDSIQGISKEQRKSLLFSKVNKVKGMSALDPGRPEM